MRLRKKDTGRFCQVQWEDVGTHVSIITFVDPDDRSAEVFDVESKESHSVEWAQVTKLGDFVRIPD